MTWVKGHYNGPEEHIKYKLNKIAHDAAVAFLKSPPHKHTPLDHPICLPSHHVSVYYNNEVITSGLQSTVAHI
jgi:hypothetical protein